MNILVTYPRFKGSPAYKVYAYKAGTTTAIDTFSDWLCTIPNAWPVVLDAIYGEAVIYAKESAKLVYTTPTGDPTNPIWSFDNYYVAQTNLVDGATTAGTTDNLYVVTSTPAHTALVDQMMLIMTPDVDSATTTTSHTFVGTGENDLTWYGPYIGATSGSVFTVQIDANGTPDTFQWKKDGGAWTTGVGITGSYQVLIEGISIKFARTTGHTINDLWALTVQLPVKVNLDSLGAKIVYKNVQGSGLVALGAGDLKANFPAQMLYSASQDAWLLVTQAAPSLTSPAPSRVRREVVGPYTVTIDDAGNQISVTNGPVTLPPASAFANQFVYLQGVGGPVPVNADGIEKIYLPYDTSGSSQIYIGQGDFETIQLQSDSIVWHILTAVNGHGFQVLSGTGNWIAPITGITYWTLAAGGGGGSAASKGGGAGRTISRWRLSVTKGQTYQYQRGVGGGGGSPGTDTWLKDHLGATLITRTGGTSGTEAGATGADSLFGLGGQGPGVPADGSGAGGYGAATPGSGSNGLMIVEW